MDNARPMQTAPLLSELSTQTHQGVGARLLRQVGGAVRNAIASGMARSGGMRRRTAPKSNRNPPAPHDAVSHDRTAPPRPSRPHAPCRKPAAAQVPPSRPARFGWLARRFGPRQPQPTSSGWPAPADVGKTPFTPEAYPGLSAEDCAILNTPVEECDPDLLHVILSVLVAHIVHSLPPELGMDAEALFSALCGRLGTAPGEAAPGVLPGEPPSAAPENLEPGEPPAAESAAEPAAPENAKPEPPPAVQPTAVPAGPENSEPDAPPASQSEPIQAQRTQPADAAATTTVAETERIPAAASPARPIFRHCARFDGSPPFRRFGSRSGSRRLHHRQSLLHHRRSCRPRSLPASMHRPPPRRLCYAACAGPP